MTISRNYPFSDIYTHVLGYVSQPNENDILENEIDSGKICAWNESWKTRIRKNFRKLFNWNK